MRANQFVPLRPVAQAWLVAGSLDILTAFVYYGLRFGVSPTRILQGIASGLLGAEASNGGLGTAALGLICHYTIALGWTVFFFFVYPRLPRFPAHRWTVAGLYGFFVSVMMSFVVVPLSRVPARPLRLSGWLVATVILIFAIGAPLSLMASKHYGVRPHST